MNIAVLFSELSGYMRACLSALRTRPNVRVLLIHWPVASEAPFAPALDDWADIVYVKAGLTRAELLARLEAFSPDGILMSGWIDRDYLWLARIFKKRGVPIVAGSDASWQGTFRQRIATLVAERLLHTAIDVLWVAGERQRVFAQRLGFTGNRCMSGYYACDWDRFAMASSAREEQSAPFFLFVGRYHPNKGLADLLDAYARYRTSTTDPWPLVCAGAGPMKSQLAGQAGVVDRGFIQPDELPVLLASAAAFVMPSRYEPWGVAIHEAATAGLPLICSSACGATTSLLEDRYNGYVVEPGDAGLLADRMRVITGLSADERADMGLRSHELSRQFTPRRWANVLFDALTTPVNLQQTVC